MNGLVWDIELLSSFQGSSSKKIDTTSFLKLCNNLEKFWFTASKALVDISYEDTVSSRLSKQLRTWPMSTENRNFSAASYDADIRNNLL